METAVKQFTWTNKAAGYENDDVAQPERHFNITLDDLPFDDTEHATGNVSAEVDAYLERSNHLRQIDTLKTRLEGALRRSDENRAEYLAEQERRRHASIEAQIRHDELILDHKREVEKLTRKHETEVANLKYDMKMLNKALEHHAADEQLLILTMKKAVSFAERVVAE